MRGYFLRYKDDPDFRQKWRVAKRKYNDKLQAIEALRQIRTEKTKGNGGALIGNAFCASNVYGGMVDTKPPEPENGSITAPTGE